MINSTHIPVLMAEVVSVLEPKTGYSYVDATFGAGGHSKALLEAKDCFVWGIDRDPIAQSIGAEMEKNYPNRFRFLTGCFGGMRKLLADYSVFQVDGIILDLGLSSLQIDDPRRGFSFKKDGPLDMRMGVSQVSALDIVNNMPETDLADLIFCYGEERYSRRVARAITNLRKKKPITRTLQLANIVRQAVRAKAGGIDPATRTFQALRIYVNEELVELSDALVNSELLLKPGGRLAVVSFHSLEDRCVKKFLFERSGLQGKPSRHSPNLVFEGVPETFSLRRRRPIKPSIKEIRENPRARSARLRWAERNRQLPEIG